MTVDDPLDGLDEVPWASLWHAYGSAADVPGHLRDVRAGVQLKYYTPLLLLGNKIVHQGTRSQAGLHAVPFLVRMALDPSVPERHHVVGLLAAIAIGLDNNYLPNGYDPEEDRANLAEVRRLSSEWPQWIAEAPNDELREMREGVCAQQVKDAEAAVFSYDAVRGALSELSVLLESDDAALRTEVAYLLAWFPEAAETAVPLLINFASSESTPVACATAIIALGLLGDRATVSHVRIHLDSDAAEVRCAAGFAVSRLGESDDRVVAALVESILEPPGESEIRLPFLNGEYAALAMQALASSSVAISPKAVEAILTGFVRSTGLGRTYIKDQIFRIAFPDGPWSPEQPFTAMNEVQQQVVGFIAALEPGAWPGFPFGYGPWGDSAHPDLRAYEADLPPAATARHSS